jgi:hypothetical protein
MEFVTLMNSPILDMFALDLVSNFLMQLVSKEKKLISDKLKDSKTKRVAGNWWNNDFHMKLVDVLTEKSIASLRSALIITLAAFLHHDIFPPEPRNNDSDVGST